MINFNISIIILIDTFFRLYFLLPLIICCKSPAHVLKYDSLFENENYFGGRHLPNIKSAERRVRVEAKAKLRNRDIKSELKTTAKKFNEAVTAKNADTAAVLFKEYTGALDKAALKGAIHKNSCDRKKAQCSKAIASISG